MTHKHSKDGYQVEYNGSHYVVLQGHYELAVFASCIEAYEAKREFEQKTFPLVWEKIPPAMRAAKRLIYGDVCAV